VAADEALRDSNWKAINCELHTIDGQPLDLNAFGTFDADLPLTGLPGRDPNEKVILKMRVWDVVLEKPTPGLHTITSFQKQKGCSSGQIHLPVPD
jgi:hypothetical protein